jgi:hypothetical protein
MQERRREADLGVRAQVVAQRRRAALVHDAVGVQQQDVLARRCREGGVDRSREAAVGAHLQQPQALAVRAGAHARGRVVARRVVGDDDLDGEVLALLGERAVQAGVDLAGVVVGDDEDREQAGARHSATIRPGPSGE